MTLASEEPGFIEATLTLRHTEDGGRRAPIRSGYRPNWWLPDEAGPVRIYPFAPDDWDGTTAGSIVEMCEGPVLIGKATVIRVRLPVPLEAD